VIGFDSWQPCWVGVDLMCVDLLLAALMLHKQGLNGKWQGTKCPPPYTHCCHRSLVTAVFSMGHSELGALHRQAAAATHSGVLPLRPDIPTTLHGHTMCLPQCRSGTLSQCGTPCVAQAGPLPTPALLFTAACVLCRSYAASMLPLCCNMCCLSVSNT
jgi:hypothetical protein